VPQLEYIICPNLKAFATLNAYITHIPLMVTHTNYGMILPTFIPLLYFKLSIRVMNMAQTIFAKILNIYAARGFLFG
jgi:hypothetical protein